MKPIIFSGPMVRAILDERKTQTRRVINFERFVVSRGALIERDVIGNSLRWAPTVESLWYAYGTRFNVRKGEIKCPYGAPGDQLWVRETHGFAIGNHGWVFGDVTLTYRADGTQHILTQEQCDIFGRTMSLHQKWRPSIHMHKWACRLFLTITDIRVERLQDISEEDAIAEGVDAVPIADIPRQACFTKRKDFSQIWDSINAKKHPWSENPWVWVVSFEATQER